MHPTLSRHSLEFDLGVRERWIWAVMIVFYFVFDPIGTYAVLDLGGIEAEPVARWFLLHFGPLGLAIQKIVFFPLVALLASVLTVAARILDQEPHLYRSVVPAIFAARGVQLAVNHVQNIAILT